MAVLKECTKCKVLKSKNFFYANKRTKSGLTAACKACTRAYQVGYRRSDEGKARNRARLKEYQQSGRGKAARRKYRLKAQYGLTPAQHLLMYVDQNGCCAICERAISYDRTHTDHDHKTGKVRGLLCRNCNIGMRFIDDADFLKSALGYKNG